VTMAPSFEQVVRGIGGGSSMIHGPSADPITRLATCIWVPTLFTASWRSPSMSSRPNSTWLITLTPIAETTVQITCVGSRAWTTYFWIRLHWRGLFVPMDLWMRSSRIPLQSANAIRTSAGWGRLL